MSSNPSAPPVDSALKVLLDSYRSVAAGGTPAHALRSLRRALEPQAVGAWQACAAELARSGELPAARSLLEAALARQPHAAGLRCQLGEVLNQASEHEAAETALRALPPEALANSSAAVELAKALRGQGKMSAALAAMRPLLERNEGSPEQRLDWLLFIGSCQRNFEAAALWERELGRGAPDPRCHAMAARCFLSLGWFAKARESCLAAIRAGIDLGEQFVLPQIAMAQRYRDPHHPDLALFRDTLRRADLPAQARASALFCLGKALDDLGDYAAAAAAFEEGNALVRATLSWSQPAWRDFVQARIKAPAPPSAGPSDRSCVPVFVVGLPRTGTTLVADRLGRHPQVRNRGELALVPYLEKWASSSADPRHPDLLRRIGRFAAAQLRQDDAPALCYIDKNPLNFRYLDLIAGALPQARIIWCRRDPRDTALSIWSQYFAYGEENGYAYALEDIAAYAQGCEQMMEHWQRTLPLPVHTVQYEQLIERTDESLSELGRFLNLPALDWSTAKAAENAFISTSSAWQARQPVYTSSVGRWRSYAPLVPALGRMFSDVRR